MLLMPIPFPLATAGREIAIGHVYTTILILMAWGVVDSRACAQYCKNHRPPLLALAALTLLMANLAKGQVHSVIFDPDCTVALE
jgi:hypothetical protein